MVKERWYSDQQQEIPEENTRIAVSCGGRRSKKGQFLRTFCLKKEQTGKDCWQERNDRE